MSQYLLVYRAAIDRQAPSPDAMAAWEAYFALLGERIVLPGDPIFTDGSVGEVGAPRPLSGYTVIEADNLEAARALAEQCPAVARGGGVEVGEITPTSALIAQAAAGGAAVA